MPASIGGSGSLSTKLRQIEMVAKLIASSNVSSSGNSSAPTSAEPAVQPESGNLINTKAG